MHVGSVSTISAAQRYLSDLYANENKSSDLIYGFLSRYNGYLCKRIWQEKVEHRDFMRSLSWMFALASKCHLDLESAYIERFPGVCPYCISSPCACLDTGKRPINSVPAHKIEEELSAKARVFRNTSTAVDFDLVVQHSKKIYPNNKIIWSFGGPWRHLVKIQEETSEVHEALIGLESEKLPLSFLGEELADCLAWIVSAWSIVYPNESLGDSFKTYYLRGCPVCFTNPCAKCGLGDERRSATLEPDALQELLDQVRALGELQKDHASEISEIVLSLEAAQQNPSEPVAIGAVNETKALLNNVEGALDRTDKNASKIASIVGAITKIVASLNL